ncbi:MAG: FAD-binding oxidoreductase [Promethearchaeota archaeon]
MSEALILIQLINTVGKEYIVKDLDAYFVSPANANEIQKIIQIANKYKFPIFTKTCDEKFHGIDDIRPGDVFLDFSRMDKIENLDINSRSITIEPGVSFLQIQEELEKYDLRVMNPIGLPASVSVLNSYVERIPLLSAPKPLLANGWQCILAMDVILPLGEILKTGASSFVDVKNLFFWPFGCGPDLSRVFTASHGTMGIVTKATIKLKKIPQSRKVLFIRFDNIENAVDVLYKIQRIEIGEQCLLVNNFNLSVWLNENSVDQKSFIETIPQWTLLLGLAGTEEKIKYQEEDLEDLDINPEGSLERFTDDILQEFYNPQRITKLLEYKAICRKISFYTTLNRIPEINLKIYHLLQKDNYPIEEVGISITPIELGHASFVEYYIYADIENQNEKERVEKLYIKLYQLIVNLGGNVDRPNKRISEIVYSKNPIFYTFLKSVKNQIDPTDIINPKKLIIEKGEM